MTGTYISTSKRLYRLDADAGSNGIGRGDYSYYHNGEWHNLTNTDWCRLLDRGYDPYRVAEARTYVNSDSWLSGMSNHADWLGSESAGVADEPLNAPAALICVATALEAAGLKTELQYLVSLVSLRDLYDSPWMRCARTSATESEAIAAFTNRGAA